MTRQIAVGIDGLKSHSHTVVMLDFVAISSQAPKKKSLDLWLICFDENGGRWALDNCYRPTGRLTGAVKHKGSRRCILSNSM